MSELWKNLSIIKTALLFFGLVCTYFIYHSGLTGDFIFDDQVNILKNPSIKIEAITFDSLSEVASSGISSPLKRPLSMVSFAVNYYFSGFDPYYFKLTNLVIHLINGVLVFILLFALLQVLQQRNQYQWHQNYMYSLSLLVTFAWLFHPIQLTSILYIVQRMTSLSSLFILLAMVCYIAGRYRLWKGYSGGWFWIVISFVWVLLAILSKEIGILVPVYCLLIEWLIFGGEVKCKADKLRLQWLFLIILVIPLFLGLVILSVYSEYFLNYSHRSFDLWERVFTQFRVIVSYLQLLLLPNLSQFGVFHDDIVVSQSLWQPISTLISFFIISVLLGFALCLSKKSPLISFGLLLFFGGHSLESTILPLELMHEHRNYLPSLGMLLVVFYLLTIPFYFVKSLKFRQVLAVIFLFFYAGMTALRADYWGKPVELMLVSVSYHPKSARTQYAAGRYYWQLMLLVDDEQKKQEYYQKAYQHFEQVYPADPYHLGGIVGIMRLQAFMDKPIDMQWSSILADRLSNYPIPTFTTTIIVETLSCATSGKCHFPEKIALEWVELAIKNPNNSQRYLDLFYNSLVVYYFKKQNWPKAKTLALEAVNLMPNKFRHWQNLIYVLEATGDEALKQQWLQKMQQYPRIYQQYLQTKNKG